MRNWHNLMTKYKLKMQLLKKFEIQNSSALRKIDSGKLYSEKTVHSKLGEFNNSVMEIKDIEKEKRYLKNNSRLLRQVIKTFRKVLMKNEAFSKLNFANVMDNMKLQCQVYHNGALVSNDVHKLTKTEISVTYQLFLNLC